MRMELAVPVRRPRAIVVLVIAIVAISAAAAWTILAPASAAPPTPPTFGVPGYQVVSGTPFTVAPGNNVAVDVSCPSGKKPLGGGASNESDNVAESFARLNASAPTVDGTGWHVRVSSDAIIGDLTMTAYAVCATA